MPVDPDQAAAVIAKIKAKYGDDAVHAGSDTSPVARLSSGSPALDYAMGGGWPWGRWCHTYGGFSSSKSLTCWRAVKEAQAQGKHCVYYNIEKQYDPVFVKSLGVNIKEPFLRIVEDSTIEGVGEQLEALLSIAHVHILDSLANAVSIDALNAKMEDWQMALSARAWGKVLVKCHERMDHNENLVIMVNQVRDAFGSGGETPPGGKFIEFISSMSLHFKRKGWLFRGADGFISPDATQEHGMQGQVEPSGMEYQVRVVKSRVSRPERSAVMRYDFSNGEFDVNWELAQAAKYHNVIPRTSEKSSYFKLPDGFLLDGKDTVQGEAKLRQVLAQEPKLAKMVKDAMLKAA